MKKIKYIKEKWFGNFKLSFQDGFPRGIEKYYTNPLLPCKEETKIEFMDCPSRLFLSFIANENVWRKLEISSTIIRYTDSKKQKLEWIYQNEFDTIPKEIKNIIIKVVRAVEDAANKAQKLSMEQKNRERDFELELEKQTETDVKDFFSQFEE